MHQQKKFATGQRAESKSQRGCQKITEGGAQTKTIPKHLIADNQTPHLFKRFFAEKASKMLRAWTNWIPNRADDKHGVGGCSLVIVLDSVASRDQTSLVGSTEWTVNRTVYNHRWWKEITGVFVLITPFLLYPNRAIEMELLLIVFCDCKWWGVYAKLSWTNIRILVRETTQPTLNFKMQIKKLRKNIFGFIKISGKVKPTRR